MQFRKNPEGRQHIMTDQGFDLYSLGRKYVETGITMVPDNLHAYMFTPKAPALNSSQSVKSNMHARKLITFLKVQLPDCRR